MAAPVITAAVVQTTGKSVVLTLTSGGSAVLPATGQLNGFSLLVGRTETVEVFAAYRSGALQITLVPGRILLASEAVIVAFNGQIGNVFSNDGTPLPMVTQSFAATNNSTATDVPTLTERDVERIADAIVDELVDSGVL